MSIIAHIIVAILGGILGFVGHQFWFWRREIKSGRYKLVRNYQGHRYFLKRMVP